MRNFRLFLFSYAIRTSMMKYAIDGSSASSSKSVASPEETTVLKNEKMEREQRAILLVKILNT